MDRISVNCPNCDTITVYADQVTLFEHPNGQRSCYMFECGFCGMRVYRSAEPHAILVLKTSGAVVKMWDFPAELTEEHRGSVITSGEILDLHLELADDNELAAFFVQNQRKVV